MVSAKKSQARAKEAAKLTKDLHDLTGQADWAKNRANFFWKQAKEYEAQGRMDCALDTKTLCED